MLGLTLRGALYSEGTHTAHSRCGCPQQLVKWPLEAGKQGATLQGQRRLLRGAECGLEEE